MTAARNRAIDLGRRRSRYQAKLALLVQEPGSRPEDRLGLIFTCCHPALAREAQVALTLRAVAGLTTGEIARAFLVPEATLAQRIVRAKQKIVAAAIPYRVPDPDQLGERLEQVLAVLYLLFNEGYLATSGPGQRRDLSEDAEWLCTLLHRLLPADPEVMGLLALMRLHLARAKARFSPGGALVLLPDQDRSLWDREAIAGAGRLIARAAAAHRPGPYQVQAAIVAVHAEAESWEVTDWPQVVALYDLLLGMADNPVVRLNRAIAVAELRGAAQALAEIDPLTESLDGYHLLHATRAELLRRLGRAAEARLSDQRALDLTGNDAEVGLLRQRLAAKVIAHLST